MKYYKHEQTGDIYAYETERDYQEWGFVGLVEMSAEEIEQHLNPHPAPPQVPAEVSRAQGKAALIQRGLWPAVIAYAESIVDETDRLLAFVALNDTNTWERTSPFLNDCATAIGLDEEQKDQLFISAAEIQL